MGEKEILFYFSRSPDALLEKKKKDPLMPYTDSPGRGCPVYSAECARLLGVGGQWCLGSLNLATSVCKEQNTISLTHFGK